MKANVLFFDCKPASEAPWTRTLWIYDVIAAEIVEDPRPALEEFELVLGT